MTSLVLRARVVASHLSSCEEDRPLASQRRIGVTLRFSRKVQLPCANAAAAGRRLLR
jgi:hypothetical protein